MTEPTPPMPMTSAFAMTQRSWEMRNSKSEFRNHLALRFRVSSFEFRISQLRWVMPRLFFDVAVSADCLCDRVVVAGTDPALGDWQPEKGLALECDTDGRWHGFADVPHGLVEFKITR